MIHITVIAMIFFCFSTLHGSQESECLRFFIKKEYLDKTTSYIIEKSKQGRPVEQEFQNYLNENPFISTLKTIDANDESSAAKIHIITGVRQDLNNKGVELQNELKYAARWEVGSCVGWILGLSLFGKLCASIKSIIPRYVHRRFISDRKRLFFVSQS